MEPILRDELIAQLRERQRAYEREAADHDPEQRGGGWANWMARAWLMGQAADWIAANPESAPERQ